MDRAIRLLLTAFFLALSSCRTAHRVTPPAFRYPELLRQAGVEGLVRFRVRLDSGGTPQVRTLEILATPHTGFTPAVRTALEGWRDSSMAGRIVEHTVLFVIIDTTGTDSVPRCRTGRDGWAVCARRVRWTTLYVH